MEMTRRTFLRTAVALGASCATVLWGCERGASDGRRPLQESSGDQEIQKTLFCFDTVCSISGIMSADALDAAVAECERYEQLFSRTLPSSDIGRINAAGGKPVQVAPETAELIKKALTYCKESGGLFDITIGAVSELWDFKKGVVPDEGAIAAALPHVGYGAVHVNGTEIVLDDPQAKLDLGGIAKGYIADKLVASLKKSGARSIIVNLGGNVKVADGKEDGTPWRVGVRDPEGQSDADVVGYIDIMDGSVVTSGLYERQFEKDGRRCWHILDPRTGYPVESKIVSASILSEQSIDGDGFTKPLFMLTIDEGLQFLEQHGGLQGCLIDAAGGFHMTDDAAFCALGE